MSCCRSDVNKRKACDERSPYQEGGSEGSKPALGVKSLSSSTFASDPFCNLSFSSAEMRSWSFATSTLALVKRLSTTACIGKDKAGQNTSSFHHLLEIGKSRPRLCSTCKTGSACCRRRTTYTVSSDVCGLATRSDSFFRATHPHSARSACLTSNGSTANGRSVWALAQPIARACHVRCC